MDNIRLILVSALAFVLFLLYQAWVEDYGQILAPTRTSSPAPALPAAPVDADKTLPSASDIPPAPASAEEEGAVRGLPGPAIDPTEAQTSRTIEVRTDVLHVEIDTQGGDIRKLFLLDYPRDTEDEADPFRLMNDTHPNLFVAQSGLYSGQQKAPSHLALFETAQSQYTLADGADSLTVPLSWKDPSGITVQKTYTFHRGSYLIDHHQKVSNASDTVWSGREYRQFQRTPLPEGEQARFIYTYTGGAIYSPEEKYDKISFDDMADSNLEKTFSGGWAAMLQHYFLGAWIPPVEEKGSYFSRALKVPPPSRYVIGMYSPQVDIAPGATHEFTARLFAGPKLQDRLADVAPGLELSVDYGWLTVLSQPLFWLLNKLHGFFGNWGWAIIMVTVLIKLAFFKLSETSYKSMANMRRVAPRLQALKDRYGDDKQRMNQAMMELYKKEKINPLGGCLPIVVQIPVFIALYWVLLESVELRQAPFILWIDNLSSPDPFYILPLLMGISMFIQQKLNPAPIDPMQAKIMMSLPFVFTIFFAFFPAGLVLYWVVNNILSIAQQWYITRQITATTK
jgi:YidC/Oxa1 family membrane protein insertase